MINVNDEIKIVPSDDLSEMRLGDLAGRTAIVLEKMCCGRKVKGYMVFLNEGSYMEENTWFVPEKSVCVCFQN